MVTSKSPEYFCAQRNASFHPTNGMAARQRVETQIVEARERQAAAEADARRYKRTSRGKSWGRS